jgi:hypothetical protein
MTRRNLVENLAPRLPEKALGAVSNDGGSHRAWDREAKARGVVQVLVAREPVQNEVPRRSRLSTSIDGLEIP